MPVVVGEDDLASFEMEWCEPLSIRGECMFQVVQQAWA